MTDDSVSIAKDFIKPIGINNFAGSELKTIQKRIEKSYPASSEKGIQSSFVLNNKLFLDTEFQHNKHHYALSGKDNLCSYKNPNSVKQTIL